MDDEINWDDWLSNVTGGDYYPEAMGGGGQDFSGLADMIRGGAENLSGFAPDLGQFQQDQVGPLYFQDTETGRILSEAEARQIDARAVDQAVAAMKARPGAAAGYSLTPGGPSASMEGPGGGRPGSYSLDPSRTSGVLDTTGLPGGGAGPAPGLVDRLSAAFMADPVKGMGQIVQAGTGLFGIGNMIAGYVKQAGGGSTVKLKNGAQVQLSPQQTAMMDQVMTQMNAQAQTGQLQAKTQQGVAAAAAGTVPGAAPSVYGTDLGNAAGQQRVQGQGIENLSDITANPNADVFRTVGGPATSAYQATQRQYEDVLAGRAEGSPVLLQARDAALAQYENKAAQDMGPGYAQSTPYQNGRAALQTYYDNLIKTDLQQRGTALAGQAQTQAGLITQPQAQRFNQSANLAGSVGSASDILGKIFGQGTASPDAAKLGLAAFSPYSSAVQGNQQLDLYAKTSNQKYDQQNISDLLSGGGKLTGMALSPYFKSVL